jgi:RimJ/RimL family protein N-acetyltransferase
MGDTRFQTTPPDPLKICGVRGSTPPLTGTSRFTKGRPSEPMRFATRSAIIRGALTKQGRSVPRLPSLKGKKTTLRRMSLEDLTDWYALEADADVKRYIGGPEKRPQAEWIEKAREALPNTHALAVIANDLRRFSGRASLTLDDRDKREWEVVVAIARAHWGKGFGKEVSHMLIHAK